MTEAISRAGATRCALTQELNRQFVDSTGDCVKILDLDGRLLYINPAGCACSSLPTPAGC